MSLLLCCHIHLEVHHQRKPLGSVHVQWLNPQGWGEDLERLSHLWLMGEQKDTSLLSRVQSAFCFCLCAKLIVIMPSLLCCHSFTEKKTPPIKCQLLWKCNFLKTNYPVSQHKFQLIWKLVTLGGFIWLNRNVSKLIDRAKTYEIRSDDRRQ